MPTNWSYGLLTWKEDNSSWNCYESFFELILYKDLIVFLFLLYFLPAYEELRFYVCLFSKWLFRSLLENNLVLIHCRLQPTKELPFTPLYSNWPRSYHLPPFTATEIWNLSILAIYILIVFCCFICLFYILGLWVNIFLNFVIFITALHFCW